MTVDFILNGKKVLLDVEPGRTLLQVLRQDLGLTGTKEGCGQGECGACTVLIDGKAVLACLTLIHRVQGCTVTTIEGVGTEQGLHPLQKAFVEHGAIQCGFCTPGMILSAVACLEENPSPSLQKIKEAISGNLCRCTGYAKIVEAVQAAGKPQKT
jgi:carbon-monoxide dehydrogenase small subunit